MSERMYIVGDQPVPGYRLVKFLGRGGFGSVWMATGPGGIEVALKIIPLDDKKGFKEFRAIHMMKNVRNAHLIPILGFWLKDSGGNIFDDNAESDSVVLKGKATELIIAMGLGEKSLMDCLDECKKEGKQGIPTDELLGYIEGAARAIDFLNRPVHNSGSGQIAIQHCDIKPQNIMIVGGEAQVCDFGLARVLGDPRTTQSGGMMSVPYTCPEIFSDTKPSHASDQYALAITYVELRTGELPFENVNNPAGLMWQIMQGNIELTRLPVGEREVIRKATHRDPGQRYPSSLEMVKDLRRIIEGVPSTPSKPKGPSGSEVPGTEIVPGYKLLRRLGQGGYGTVWEAQAPGGKSVAIKIIHNVEGMSGKQEFKALELIKSLEHEHLLDLHAYWLLTKEGEIIPDDMRHRDDAPAASTLVIATKLATKNLLQRLAECQQQGQVGIPVPELLGYLNQAAQAVDFLNEAQHHFGDGVVAIQHRDIKPENILLVRNVVKVGDFGLAKVLEGSSAQVHGNSTGYTPHYAAPELFNGKVSRWTDQYSLAITYFKLRTGSLPFDQKISMGDLLSLHLEGKLDLSALSESEREVIAQATALVAERRYPTCLDMVTALERALSSTFRLPETSEVKTVVPAPTKPPARKGGTALKPKTKPASSSETMAPLEEVFQNVDTLVPGNETPIPQEESPTPMPWNDKSGKSKPWLMPAASTATDAEPAAAALAYRRRKKGTPIGILVAVLLLVGGSFGAGAWLIVNKLPKPSTSTGPTNSTEGSAQRPNETKPILPVAPPKISPPSTTPHQSKPDSLEIARKFGQNQQWDEMARELKKDLILLAHSANKDALWFLAQHHLPLAEPLTGEALKSYLDELAKVKAVQRQVANDWEGQELGKLSAEVVRAVKRHVNDAVANAQTNSVAVFPAMELAQKLSAYDAEREATFWPTKRQEAVDKLEAAASQIPKKVSPTNPLALPWKPEDAEQVYEWLNVAQKILAGAGQKPTLKLRKELALAAMLKKKKDRSAWDWLEDLPLTGGREEIPYLMAKAQARPEDRGWRPAFDLYIAVKQSIKDPNEIPAPFCEKVLDPAILNGEKALENSDLEVKKPLAGCYLAKGEIIEKHRNQVVRGRDWHFEKVIQYEKATEYDPTPEAWLKLSGIHLELAKTLPPKGDGQRENLSKALADVEQASEKHPHPGEVLYQKGKVLLALIEHLEDKKRYPEAITALTNALKKGGLTEDQKIDANFSLGDALLAVKKPDYIEARRRLAESLQLMSQGRKRELIIEKALTHLLLIGDKQYFATLPNEGQPEKQKRVETAIACYADLTHYGQVFEDLHSEVNVNYPKPEIKIEKVKNDYFEFFGANRLRYVGDSLIFEDGFDKKKDAPPKVRQDPQPVEAYQIYSRGLPEDLTKADPAHVWLLTARNILCVKFDKELKGKGLKNYPDLKTLIAHAERAVELATSGHPYIEPRFIIDAHATAYQCYDFAGRTKEGQAHLRAILKMDISAEKRKEIETELGK